MKGIIMAGGEGTRLRPLTCDCPKPMMRLMNRPVMAYALELMKRHNIVDIAATLGYRPDAIRDAFGDGSGHGVRLRYYVERTPLGTAGGVRQAADFLDETFVVLSGDGVTDLDITRALGFHRARRADATLVLKRAENPLDYGVVDTDPDGRVRSFHEKPDWADVLSDTVNTGIYILEPRILQYIPGNRPCDFGHELFPRLVREGLNVYGYVTDAYWCDIGDVRAYLGAHIDAMEGRIRLDGLEAPEGRAIVRPGASVDRSAVLEGPCLVDAGARICAGARIGPYSVIGEGCIVGEGASIKRGVLWPGARLMARAQARGCVLASGASLGEDAQAYEESVVGARASVGPRGVLLPGVKLWPGRRVAEGERLDANRVWAVSTECDSAQDAMAVDGPAGAARAAQAFAAALEPREVVLGHDGSAGSVALWHAAAAGAMAQGAQVIDAGRCALPVLRHALGQCGAGAALYISEGALYPLNGLGAQLESRQRRAVSALNARQDFARDAARPVLPVLKCECADAAYAARAAGLIDFDPDRCPKVALSGPEGPAKAMAERVLARAGLRYRRAGTDERLPLPGEVGVRIEPSGEGFALSSADGTLTEAQQQMMIAWLALEAGCRALLLPAGATRGIGALAVRYGATTESVDGSRARWMNALTQRQPLQFELWFDGIATAMRALAALGARGLSLSDWRRDMPDIHRRSRVMPLPPGQNGRVLHAFAQAVPGAKPGGGVHLEREGGWAWIGADEGHSRLRIVTEGTSAEFADELCDFCESTLKRQLSSQSPSGSEGN